MQQFFSTLILLCFFSYSSVAERPKDARSLVSHFQEELLEVMKAAENLGVEGRYAKLAPTLNGTFHLPIMMRIAAGKYWGETNTNQRARLVSAFRKMSISTLATLFSGYSGEKFEFVAERPGIQAKTRIVSTKLVKSDGEEVDIAYVAAKVDAEWWLIDVIIDNGISELKVRISEYDTILNESGPEGLIKVFESKSKQLIAME